MKLEVRNLNKLYGAKKALNDVSLTLEPEKIYGLLGRNGAGKTTLLNIINNRIFRDSGDILLDGKPLVVGESHQNELYFVGEATLFPPSMTVMSAFKWTNDFNPGFNMDEALRLSDEFNLNVETRIKSLSTGYETIFKLIIALCVDAKFIFLDEPVNGLDANHRELFYKVLLESYNKNPRTFIISTHLIGEVTNLIEEAIIIHKGKLLTKEACDDLLETAYNASGTISAIDEFCVGKTVMHSATIGGLKTVCIKGNVPYPTPNGISISTVDLQSLFVHLTNDTAS